MITEHDDKLVDQYLNQQLSTTDAAAFEIRMMEEPALLERVQLVEAMKQGLQQETAQLRAVPVQTATILPFAAWLRQPLSLAASILVATLFMRELLPSATTTSTAIGTVMLLENNRGTEAAVFTGPAPYLFQLDVGLGNNADNFTVTVRDAANAEIVALNGLHADADGWVRLVVTDPLAGDYQAELAWTDPQGNAQTRSFSLSVSQ